MDETELRKAIDLWALNYIKGIKHGARWFASWLW